MKTEIDTPYEREAHIAERLPDAERIASIVGLNGSSVPDLAELLAECELEFLLNNFSDLAETGNAPPNQRKAIRSVIRKLKEVQREIHTLDQPELHERWRTAAHKINQNSAHSLESADEIRSSLYQLNQRIAESVGYLAVAHEVDGRSIARRSNHTNHERIIVTECISFWLKHTGEAIKTSDADFEYYREIGADLKEALKPGPLFVCEVVEAIGGSISAQSTTKKIQEANRPKPTDKSER